MTRPHHRSRPAGAPRLRYAAIAVAVAGAFVLSACSSSGGDSSGSDGTYSVAILGSLTGTNASQGIAATNGVQAAFDYVNAHGGVNGHKIKYNVNDDQSSTTTAQAVGRSIVAGNPVAISDMTISSSQATRTALYQNAKIPVFTTAGNPLPLYPWLFGGISAGQIATTAVNAVTAAVGGSLAGKKIAVIFDDAPGGRTPGTKAKNLIEQAGGTVPAFIAQPIGAPSFANGAASVISKDADAAISLDVTDSTVIEAKALVSAGFKNPIVAGITAVDDPLLKSINAPNYYGIRLVQYADSGTPMYQAAQQYKHTDGITTQFWSFGWVSGYEIIDGLTKCGYPCSAAKLTTTLNGLGTFSVPGQTGPFGVSDTNRSWPSQAHLYHWDSTANASAAFGPAVPLGPPNYPPATS